MIASTYRGACAFSCLTLCAITLASCSRGLQSSAVPAVIATSASSHRGPSSAKYQVLFNFGSSVNGYYGTYPDAPLINVNGTLYGTTSSGGKPGYVGHWGTVFSITPTGTLTVLHTFGDNDGWFPLAGVINVKGTLYGTTSARGLHNAGTVFSMGLDGGNFRVLHAFGKGSDGKYPMAGLVAVDGKLYGTTSQGGASNVGTVFSVRITDGKEHVLHSFSNNPDGAYPLAGLIKVKGALYGTTEFGGRGAGAVYSVDENGNERVLYGFGDPPDGHTPMAGLLAVNGMLYGTTYQSGDYDNGTIFSVSTAGDEHVLHSFTNTDGAKPVAGLIAVQGVLYGTTQQGGAASAGTVFSIKPGGKGYRLLHSFNQAYTNDGISPQASLLAIHGTLYGTTYQGGISLPSCIDEGTCDYGTVFALTP